MTTVLGIICVLFGGFSWLAQLVSAVNFPLAQRLGLQEKSEGTDALYQQAELNSARWDVAVLWILPAAGILMLSGHHWWPYLGLLAGGIYLDGAGREAAKYTSLKKSGVRLGNPREYWITLVYFVVMFLVGLGVVIYSLFYLAIQSLLR